MYGLKPVPFEIRSMDGPKPGLFNVAVQTKDWSLLRRDDEWEKCFLRQIASVTLGEPARDGKVVPLLN